MHSTMDTRCPSTLQKSCCVVVLQDRTALVESRWVCGRAPQIENNILFRMHRQSTHNTRRRTHAAAAASSTWNNQFFLARNAHVVLFSLRANARGKKKQRRTNQQFTQHAWTLIAAAAAMAQTCNTCAHAADVHRSQLPASRETRRRGSRVGARGMYTPNMCTRAVWLWHGPQYGRAVESEPYTRQRRYLPVASSSHLSTLCARVCEGSVARPG